MRENARGFVGTKRHRDSSLSVPLPAARGGVLDNPLISGALRGRAERTIRAVLRVLFLAVPATFVLVAMGGGTRLELFSVALLFAWVLALVALNRTGRFIASVYGCVFGLVAFATLINASYGSLRGAGTLAYVAAIVVAGMFLSAGGLAATTLASMACAGGLIVAQAQGLLPTPDYGLRFTNWALYSLAFACVGVTVHYSQRMLAEVAQKAAAELEERRRAEAARSQTESKYAALFASSQHAICIADEADARHLEVNDAWVRYTGLAREDVIGRTAHEIGLWVHDEPRRVALERLREAGRFANLPAQFRRADGRVMDVLISGVSVELDGRRCIVWSWSDLTDEQRAEEHARQATARFVAAFERSPDAISLARLRDGAMVAVNDAWVRVAGFQREAAIGKRAVDIGMWRDPERANLLAKLQRDGRLENEPATIRRPDGTVRHMLASGALVDFDGEPCVMWMGRDITDLYEAQAARDASEAAMREAYGSLERRVADRTADLQAANRELESFSYSVSHDLRAPLRAIAGFSAILREDFGPAVPPGAADYLVRIEQNATRMGQLIDDLLELSRAGRTALAPGLVDMTALAKAVVADLHGTEAGAQVVVDALPPITGDATLLRQVWQNLVANAFKFSSRTAAPRIEIGGEARDGETEYWVRDNGAGFDMRYASKLFGIFQRLHSPAEFEGTGVGLAIVHRIVARHGGRVSAEGAPDAGATFRFVLPERPPGG